MSEKLTFGYRFLRRAFRALFPLVARLDVRGAEKMPDSGPVLIASNHLSLLEGPLVFATSPRHPITVLAKKEYENTLIGKLIFSPLGPIYVDRGEVDRKALKEMLKRLKEDAVIGVAPEGTRSRTGGLLPGKEGTAYLALQADAWVLPVAVWGQEKLLSDLKRFRRPTIHARFSDPFKITQGPEQSRNEAIAEGTERMMHTLARMLPPEYRGHYADIVLGPPQER